MAAGGGGGGGGGAAAAGGDAAEEKKEEKKEEEEEEEDDVSSNLSPVFWPHTVHAATDHIMAEDWHICSAPPWNLHWNMQAGLWGQLSHIIV